MLFEQIDKELAWKYNHNSNIPYHKNRDKFFEGIKSYKINNSNVIYYLNKYSKRPLYIRMLGKGKRIIKKVLNK